MQQNYVMNSCLQIICLRIIGTWNLRDSDSISSQELKTLNIITYPVQNIQSSPMPYTSKKTSTDSDCMVSSRICDMYDDE